MSQPQVPDDAEAKHPVAGINDVQSRIGNDLQNGVLHGLVVVRTLVKMIAAEVQRVVDLDVFFGNNLIIFDNL